MSDKPSSHTKTSKKTSECIIVLPHNEMEPNKYSLQKKKKMGVRAKLGLVYVAGISSETLFILNYFSNLNMDLF